jgi:hypothetical protein
MTESLLLSRERVTSGAWDGDLANGVSMASPISWSSFQKRNFRTIRARPNLPLHPVPWPARPPVRGFPDASWPNRTSGLLLAVAGFLNVFAPFHLRHRKSTGMVLVSSWCRYYSDSE